VDLLVLARLILKADYALFIFAWVSRMGSLQGSRRRQLARLQLELAKASRRLDEIENRSRRKSATATRVIDETSNSPFENVETRFAACVASGMSKIRSTPNVS
jgi:hypothetical protein